MIITIDDCPFEFGDEVWFENREDIYESIICPSCNGTGKIHTGIQVFKSEDDGLKMAIKDAKTWKEELVLNCNNCTNGKIRYKKDVITKKYYGTLESIYAYHSTGWRFFEFIVRLNNGKTKIVEGSKLRQLPDRIIEEKERELL